MTSRTSAPAEDAELTALLDDGYNARNGTQEGTGATETQRSTVAPLLPPGYTVVAAGELAILYMPDGGSQTFGGLYIAGNVRRKATATEAMQAARTEAHRLATYHARYPRGSQLSLESTGLSSYTTGEK